MSSSSSSIKEVQNNSPRLTSYAATSERPDRLPQTNSRLGRPTASDCSQIDNLPPHFLDNHAPYYAVRDGIQVSLQQSRRLLDYHRNDVGGMHYDRINDRQVRSKRGYLDAAERIGTWKWLYGKRASSGIEEELDKGPKNLDDAVVLVTKFGDIIVATLVLQAAMMTLGAAPLSSSRQQTMTFGKVRAWTVEQKYRNVGLGTDLLVYAMDICQERGWQGPMFDENHAHSVRVLPSTFNSDFDGTERRARKILEKIVSRRDGGDHEKLI